VKVGANLEEFKRIPFFVGKMLVPLSD